jgi:phospholipid transport system substrate-binding protein
VHQENGSWRITDVLLSDAHISQAAAQRADFSSTLASGGVTGLIAVLERKVQNYSTN